MYPLNLVFEIDTLEKFGVAHICHEFFMYLISQTIYRDIVGVQPEGGG